MGFLKGPEILLDFSMKHRIEKLSIKPTIRRYATLLGLAGLIFATGCSDPKSPTRVEPTHERMAVVASNFPLHCFAKRIGGVLVEPRFLPPSDGDPAFWKPSLEAISTMQAADLVILNGAGYESWIDKVSLSNQRTLDTTDGLADRFIAVDDQVTHQHGPSGEHSHGSTAFTTWMDFTLAAEQADAIRAGLARRLPDHETTLQVNLDKLAGDLADLDHGFKAWGESLTDQPLLGSHPVYQYFANRYGLNLKSVHWEPDEFPDAAAWEELESLLADHPARWMIWEGDPLEETVQRLKEQGVSSVIIDPCGNRPESGDFMSMMQANLERAQGMLK
jgi:zinc transport system substrate-binding protein